MTAQAQPRAIRQADIDWYKNRFPASGAADIERWTAAGEIVIIEGDNHGTKN